MADNYTQFSLEVELSNEKELKWWQVFTAYTFTGFATATHLDLPSKEAVDQLIQDNSGEPPCFEYELSKERIWLYAEESGSVDHVCAAIHLFLKDCRPNGDDLVEVLWADTCSKPRIDNFGGGTAVVTKDGIGWCGPSDQAEYAKRNIRPFFITDTVGE